MTIDFSLILALGAAITGAIWLIDILFFARKRKHDDELIEGTGRERDTPTNEEFEPFLVEYSKFLFPVFFIVFVLRGFVVEPFKIPSGSMIPTLEVGDFILVSKFSYGLRIPVINKKILDFGKPERGDVVVFRYPRDPKIDYIKRLIGLPGDEIAYHDKQLYINGELVKETEISKSTFGFTEYTRYNEVLPKANLPKGYSHEMRLSSNPPHFDLVTTVPKGHYFMMGDNRDNSNDGRVWGFVPDANLKGRAFAIWMNWQGWNHWPKWSRVSFIK